MVDRHSKRDEIPDWEMVYCMTEDQCGEVLRAFTFVGGGFGCYSNFDVRKDAEPLDKEKQAGFWRLLDYEDAGECAEMGDAYSFRALGLEVEVYWFWDGDGTLAYLIGDSQPLRCVVNTDCKKDYGWREEEVDRVG